MRELMTVELIAARITVYELEIRQNRTFNPPYIALYRVLLSAMSGHCRSTTASVEWFLLLRMRRPRPGGDRQHLWPGTQILYSVHTAQEPNDRIPQERSFKWLISRKSDLLQSANSVEKLVTEAAIVVAIFALRVS